MIPTITNAIPAEWQDYIAKYQSALEVVPAVLYSTATYTSGATLELNFFQTPKGSRLDLTNMTTPGQLPIYVTQLIQFIRVKYKTRVQSDDSGTGTGAALPSQADDIVQLSDNGVARLTIGEKKYGPWPLWMLAAGNQVGGMFSTGSDLLADYAQVMGSMYALTPYLALLPMQNFEFTISWPAGALTLTNNVDIVVLFDGQGSRAVA